MDDNNENLNETKAPLSRAARNSELYKEVSKKEIDGYEVKSNATVIGSNNNIDIDKIKSILDTHYKDTPQRKSIALESRENEEEESATFETKEYDINAIIDKAKEEKEEDYHEERAKKLRNTEFDILSNLNIDPKDYIEDYDDDDQKEEKEDNSKELLDLINTINVNETKEEKVSQKEEKPKIVEKEETDVKKVSNADITKTDPLDIFEDLKGDSNTTILEGLSEKTEEMIKTMQNTVPIKKEEPKVKDIHKTTSLDSDFFTKSNSLKKSDFDDFKDIEGKKVSPLIKIVILLIIIAFIVGVVILVKTIMQ